MSWIFLVRFHRGMFFEDGKIPILEGEIFQDIEWNFCASICFP